MIEIAVGAAVPLALLLLVVSLAAARRCITDRDRSEELNERLSDSVRHDPLTGLLNRRALAEDLDARPPGVRATVLLCGVDHFKDHDDALGHQAGDDALRRIALAVRGALRAEDRAYRYGAEQLLILLDRASVRTGAEVAERIRGVVRAAAIEHPHGIDGLATVSIGVAHGIGDVAALIAEADAALHAAKTAGRDRVVSARARAAAEPRAATPR